MHDNSTAAMLDFGWTGQSLVPLLGIALFVLKVLCETKLKKSAIKIWQSKEFARSSTETQLHCALFLTRHLECHIN